MWGFISKYSKLNYKINVLILTNANKGAPEIYSSKIIEKIRNEAKQANKLIGTDKLFFENLPALNLNNYPIYQISNLEYPLETLELTDIIDTSIINVELSNLSEIWTVGIFLIYIATLRVRSKL